MLPDDSTLKALSELAALPLHQTNIDDTAEAVVSMAMSTVECDFAGLSVLGEDGRLETLAPTGPIVAQADALQYELNEGPCVAAFFEQDTFMANDLASDPRWPSWGPKAAALGLGSLLATRLTNGGRTLGALNLYSVAHREFSTEDGYIARLFGVHAAATLLAVRSMQDLRVAIDGRTVIGQAQGILMERFGIEASQAFSVLRRYSQDRNIKLREVAADVVARRALPDGAG